jgi:hypothetical protein
LEEELKVKNQNTKLDYKINTNLSYGFLKDRILELLFKEAPLEEVFKEVRKFISSKYNSKIEAQQRENGFAFDDDLKLAIFETVFDQVDGHESDGHDYRVTQSEKVSDKNRAKMDFKEPCNSGNFKLNTHDQNFLIQFLT